MTTYLVTPAFCKAKMLEDCLDHIYRDHNTLPKMTHVIIDNHYPIDKANNRNRIQQLAKFHGCVYVDSGKDLGLHHGINNAIERVGIGPGDLLLICDPDDRPEAGSLSALIDVMDRDDTIAVAALNYWIIAERWGDQMRESLPHASGGPRYWVHPNCEQWMIAAYNMGFVHKAGGFQEQFAYYGGIEAYFHQHWKRLGMKLVYLPDFQLKTLRSGIASEMIDSEYWNYKQDHISDRFKGSFEEWIEKFCPHRLTGDSND